LLHRDGVCSSSCFSSSLINKRFSFSVSITVMASTRKGSHGYYTSAVSWLGICRRRWDAIIAGKADQDAFVLEVVPQRSVFLAVMAQGHTPWPLRRYTQGEGCNS
jgi:hypothetical protein